MLISPVEKTNSNTLLLERLVLVLLSNDVNKIVSNRKEATIFSILYVFSEDRIAKAMATLCNNNIIYVRYDTKSAYFTPQYQHFRSIFSKPVNVNLNRLKLNKKDFEATAPGDNGIIYDFLTKLAIMQSLDDKNDYEKILDYFNFKEV